MNANHYYRLKQVDIDGMIAYSPVRVLSFNNAQLSNPVYFNSTTQSLVLKQQMPAGSIIRILDMQGRELAVYSAEALDSIPSGSLSTGV